VKKIGIVVKPDTEAIKKADELERWLRSKYIEIVRRENVPPKQRVSDKDKSSAPADLCCVFVLGGDGTFLSAVRWIGNQKIPVLGVKFLEVGFLAEIAEESLFSVAEAVLNNKLITEPSMRLLVRVIRKGEDLVCETVLNDIVINKNALGWTYPA